MRFHPEHADDNQETGRIGKSVVSTAEPEIDRYEFQLYLEEYSTIVSDPDGSYVEYEDHITRIRQERERAVRECAEIAVSHYKTFDCQKALAEHDDMGYARATTRLEVARAILALIDGGSK